MNVIPCRINLVGLRDEVFTIPLEVIPDGSGGHHGGSGYEEGWISRLSMTRVKQGQYPLLTQAVDQLSGRIGHHNVAQIMVNKLHAGGELKAHRDGLPDHWRWHLPVITSPGVVWWDEIEGKRHMLAGHWYGPVPYCGVLHSMSNPTSVDRVHIVVDFQKGT